MSGPNAYDKDISTILMRPTSNQIFYVTANSHTIHLNHGVAVHSNVSTIQSNLARDVFPPILHVTTSNVVSFVDVIPNSNGLMDLAKNGARFKAVHTDRLTMDGLEVFKEALTDSIRIEANVNVNRLSIDNSNDFLPVGSILPFAGGGVAGLPPPGFLWCDGATKSKFDFSELYAVIEDRYGTSAIDSLSFVVPDFRGRSPLGAGWGDGGISEVVDENYGGAENVTLGLLNLPSHNHTFILKTQGSVPAGTFGLATRAADAGTISSFNKRDVRFDTVGSGSEPDLTTDIQGFSITTGSTGTATAFSVVHPVICTNFIIKY